MREERYIPAALSGDGLQFGRRCGWFGLCRLHLLSFFVQVVVISSGFHLLSRPSWFKLLVMHRLIRCPLRVRVSEIVLSGLIVDFLKGSSFGTHPLEFSTMSYLFLTRRYWFVEDKHLGQMLGVFRMSTATSLISCLLRLPSGLIPCGKIVLNGLVDGTLWLLLDTGRRHQGM